MHRSWLLSLEKRPVPKAGLCPPPGQPYCDADPRRNMVVRVVDKALLSRTGGIVQGMSGSPILQNGRLVGAVTHVLVNDPTRGYGIFAQTMLEQAEQVASTEK